MSTSLAEANEVRATRVMLSDERLSIDLADGRSLLVPLEWYPRLLHGTDEERRDCQIVVGGHALHWPRLDEDITVAGLMNGRRSGETEASINAWLKKRLAQNSNAK